VQSNRSLRAIQKVLAGRVVKVLNEVATEKPEDYAAFWREMGVFIKQGVATGAAEKNELLTLLRFPSTRSEGKATSLADYKGRMIEGQDEIYYLLGSDEFSVATSPHLDPFKARSLEVLLLSDPFDGYMMQSVHEFESKKLRNVDDPSLTLPGEVKPKEDEAEPVADADWAQVVARFKTVLGDRVTEVRESQLLTDSPARLLSTDTGFEREMQRVRRLVEDDYHTPPKILELNRRHPLVRNLASQIAASPSSPIIDPAIELLFDNLLLLEGLHPNPAAMAPRIQMMLERATK
jgi:molecular chaperone HtpG